MMNENLPVISDSDKKDKIIMQMLMTSIVESRAMMKVILQVISDNDHALFNQYLESIKKVQELEYQQLKLELFKDLETLQPQL